MCGYRLELAGDLKVLSGPMDQDRFACQLFRANEPEVLDSPIEAVVEVIADFEEEGQWKSHALWWTCLLNYRTLAFRSATWFRQLPGASIDRNWNSSTELYSIALRGNDSLEICSLREMVIKRDQLATLRKALANGMG